MDVTITATWLASDKDLGSRLYMASDSRISGPEGRLLDEGVKLFQLPVRLLSQGSLPGLAGSPAYETSIGIVCAGSTLIFQQTYAALVALLSQVQCVGPRLVLPTVAELSEYTARVLTLYYRSLGSNRPSPAPVCMIIGGVDPASRSPVAFELRRDLDAEGVYEFVPQELDLAVGNVEFRGDAAACLRASGMWGDQAEYERRAASYNGVLHIIESLSANPAVPSVGGRVQVGYTSPLGFHRVARAGTSEGMSDLFLHGLPLLSLGPIGSSLLPTLSALA